MTRAERLTLLRQLARLRSDRATARLAQVQGLIDTLEAQADALRQAPTHAPATVQEAVMQDRWSRHRMQSLAQLNVQIARLRGAAQPQRELCARETARENVLGKLARRS